MASAAITPRPAIARWKKRDIAQIQTESKKNPKIRKSETPKTRKSENPNFETSEIFENSELLCPFIHRFQKTIFFEKNGGFPEIGRGPKTGIGKGLRGAWTETQKTRKLKNSKTQKLKTED